MKRSPATPAAAGMPPHMSEATLRRIFARISSISPLNMEAAPRAGSAAPGRADDETEADGEREGGVGPLAQGFLDRAGEGVAHLAHGVGGVAGGLADLFLGPAERLVALVAGEVDHLLGELAHVVFERLQVVLHVVDASTGFSCEIGCRSHDQSSACALRGSSANAEEGKRLRATFPRRRPSPPGRAIPRRGCRVPRRAAWAARPRPAPPPGSGASRRG